MRSNTEHSPAERVETAVGFLPVTCAICGDVRPKEAYAAREMVHGTREVFRYALCGGCGVLFLVDVPPSLAPYYRDYYSTGARPKQRTLRLRSRLKHAAGGFALRHVGHPASPVLRRLFPLAFQSLIGLGLRRDSRILDVGCGNGALVEILDWCGFHNVLGCDPFIESEIAFAGGARVVRQDIFGVEGTFDLVMLHHAYEHVPNPAEVAWRISELLAPGGRCVLRFPNVESVEFNRYRGNWWGIHAPRHFFLYSRRSIEMLFAPSGMEIESSHCDSQLDHYLYSDEYARDIDDRSPLSYRADGQGTWTPEEIRERHYAAREYNARMVGDWIVYVVRKPAAAN